jgi:hypothetical protein
MYLPVKQGDNVKLLCMLTSGHSVLQKFSEAEGGTLLHVAALEGHVLTTYFLLQVRALSICIEYHKKIYRSVRILLIFIK